MELDKFTKEELKRIILELLYELYTTETYESSIKSVIEELEEFFTV